MLRGAHDIAVLNSMKRSFKSGKQLACFHSCTLPWVRGRRGDYVQHVRQGREGLPGVSVENPEAPADDVRRLPLHDARENLAVTQRGKKKKFVPSSWDLCAVRRAGGFETPATTD